MAQKVKDEKYWADFGKKMGKKFGGTKVSCHCSLGRGSGLALMIILIGLYWLAKDMGWIQPQISTWAVIFIVIGTYWLVKSLLRRH